MLTRQKINLAISIAITSGIFILDVLTPVGYAVYLLYVIPLFVAAPATRSLYFPLFSFVYTILTISSFFLSPPGGDPTRAVVNRIMGVLALWSISFLLGKRKQAAEALNQAHRELERGVDQRTAELTQVNVSLQVEMVKRKRTEERFKQLALQNKLILESAGEGIFGLDLKGNHTFVNPAAAKMLGYEADELIGLHSHSVWHHTKTDGSPYPKEECPIYMALKDGAVHHISDEVFWKKNGTDFPVEYFSTPILEGDKVTGAVVTFQDITWRRQLEEEIMKTRKLESVGILAGGIAHDFNNLLQSVIGYIGLAKSYAKEDKLSEILDKAERASNNARELSFRLLTFSKGGDPIMRRVNIAGLIKEAANYPFCNLNISCEFVIPDDLYPVEVDEGQLFQVIRQIGINAEAAMPDGGTITFSGKNVTVGEDSGLALKSGEYVRISISDTGHGIAPEHLEKIFDPYFTTKKMGNEKGTGLGLSVCYSIIKKHRGQITVDSKVGAGTTFHIYLPASGNQA